MYLINDTYFIGKINIPNLLELQSEASTVLNYFIDEKVRLFLQDKLSSQLFNDLDANITDGVLDDNAPQKWLNFVNGCDYTKDGKTYTWRGLIYNNGAIPKSLLAEMVFTYWLEDSVSTVLGTGEVSIEAKNALSYNSTQRLVTVWNEFVEMYQGNNCLHNRNFYYIGGVPIIDYYNIEDNRYVNMVKFLKDNETDYPNTNLTLYKFKNQLGL